MTTIRQYLPADRFARTARFPDVIELRDNEDSGYTGTGQYVVATSGMRILGLMRIPGTDVSRIASTAEISNTASQLRPTHPDADLWHVLGSSYELMSWTKI
jgi:hypothetical protein